MKKNPENNLPSPPRPSRRSSEESVVIAEESGGSEGSSESSESSEGEVTVTDVCRVVLSFYCALVFTLVLFGAIIAIVLQKFVIM